jgi:hypothetical protein
VVDVLVMTPAVPESPVGFVAVGGVKTTRFGVLKLARLSKLKNSARNCKRSRASELVALKGGAEPLSKKLRASRAVLQRQPPDVQVLAHLTHNDKQAADLGQTEYYDTIFRVAESPVQKNLFWASSDDGPVHITGDGSKN